MLQGRRILLGITGGIAAYKAAELTRELIKNGALVKIVMTAHATEFITPLTMQTLARKPVYLDMFQPIVQLDVEHISLAEEAEVVVVAPATANILGKISSGIADDLLSTVIMATKSPVIFAPAMNKNMWENQIVQGNIAKLRKWGYFFVAPGYGDLACSVEGEGRLAPIFDIVEEIEGVLSRKDLCGQSILVTAGPTREPFDPVRFISNNSSGKMGYALARVAQRRGAAVTLVSGPTSLPAPPKIDYVPVTTAQEMRQAVWDRFHEATVIIKAAAVADFCPDCYSDQKIKKDETQLNLSLKRNPDILAELGLRKGERLLVGFAMETVDLIANARQKLHQKNADLIVANDLGEEGAGFAGDTNIVTLLYSNGTMEKLPRLDKLQVAEKILDRVRDLLDQKRGR